MYPNTMHRKEIEVYYKVETKEEEDLDVTEGR
jgi:hypothetical protein